MTGRSVITLKFIASAMLLAASGQVLAYMEDNLIIRYDFNKGRGALVSDQTGLGFYARLNGNAAFIDNDPWGGLTGGAKFGNSIRLNGDGDNLTVESDFHNSQLNLGQVAIAAWIKPAAAGMGKQYLVSKINHGDRTGYALAIDATTGYLHAEFYLRGSAAVSEVVGSTAIRDDRWSHVAATFNGRTIRLYVHGTLENSISVTGNIAACAEKFTIGALSGFSPSNGFTGAIDELRLYSALTAADISTLAAAENGEPDLIHYESFDSISRIWLDAPFIGATHANLDTADLVEGPFDNGLHFQNEGQRNERLSWPVARNLDPERGHITLWFRPDWDGNSAGGNSILETENNGLAGNGTGDGIRVYRWDNGKNQGEKQFRLLARNNYVLSANQEPSGVMSWAAGEWHYLELIWDVTAATPYLAYIIDGELATINDQVTVPASGMPARLFLGSANEYSSMAGTVDELKIYSRPQYDVFDPAEKIAAIKATNRADGRKQEYETVYNSADAAFPGISLAAKDPVSFFQTAPFERVYAGDLPDAADTTDTLNYNVATNDTESLFFNIYSQLDAEDVRITVGDLKDSGGRTIVASEDMRLTVVKNWWQRTAQRADPNPFIPIFVPELLMYDDRYNFKHDDYDLGVEASHSWDDLPDFPIPASASVDTELRAYTSKQFMLNITIPAAAAAGTYSTVATVTGTGISDSRVVTLNVNVRDIRLPKADKDFIIFHRAQYLGSANDRNFRDYVSGKDYYLKELQDIFDHGFNGVMAYGLSPEYIDDIAGVGFDGKVILSHVAAGSPMVAALNQAFGEAWFFGWDEPTEDAQLDAQMRRSSDIHAAGGKAATTIYLPWADCLNYPHRLRPDTDNGSALADFCPYTGDNSFNAAKRLDMEVLSVNHRSVAHQEYFYGLLNNTVAKDAAQQSYYWQSRAEDARVNRYFAGFHLYLTDLDGIWPYVYIHNNGGDPFDDLDAAVASFGEIQREMNTVYPTQQGPMSTIEWEAMREGIDDYRYLQLWRSLHDDMTFENPIEAARSKDRIELNEMGIGLALFRHQIAGALNLSHADFAATRELIAEEILALQVSLADPDDDDLSTAAEWLIGTDPFDEDTDNDWLRDGLEVNLLGTDPLEADTDNDGVNDFPELMFRTNPFNSSSYP